MTFFLILPLILGVTVVMQGTLNRQIGLNHGLATALLINSIVFLVLNVVVYVLAKYTPSIFPEFIQVRDSDAPYNWKYMVPGFCGFLLVLGLPWAIDNIGAAKALLLLIISQIIAGFVWDYMNAEAPMHWLKFAGAALTMVGGALILFAP